MFVTAIQTIAKKQKQLICLSISEQIHKMWYIHTIEFYSAILENTVLVYMTTYIKPKNILRS